MFGNNVLQQRMIKSLLPTLLPMLDGLQEPIANFINTKKEQTQLQADEKEIIGIIKEKDGKIYICISVIDDSHRITRTTEIYPFENILDLIKNTVNNGK